MSRSSPPSGLATRLRQEGASHPVTPHRPGFRRRLAIRVAALMRWLHIYLSMFGLAAVLFFGVTGLTLNHPDWVFGEAERTVDAEGKMEPKWLRDATGSGAASDPARGVAKLEVVEHLRKVHAVRGALAEFRADEQECVVTFKGPGYSADAFIDRGTGSYRLTQSFHGFIAIVNDLHKGRDTGPVWSWVIDVSAVLMSVISLTGLVLILYLKRRRLPGLAVAAVGVAVIGVIVWLWVP